MFIIYLNIKIKIIPIEYIKIIVNGIQAYAKHIKNNILFDKDVIFNVVSIFFLSR